MRVCHVSPHLPPDQAANALLPAELGRWMAAAGGEVRFVAHAAAQGATGTVELAGRVWRVPRRVRASGLRRLMRLDAWHQVRVIEGMLEAAARDADLVHLHSNGLIIEAAAAWARRRRKPHVLTLYGTEIWHYRPRWPIDPFARAYRGAGAVTFYSGGLLEKARRLGLSRPQMRVVYPAVRSAFAPRDAATRAAWRTALGIPEPILFLNVKRLHELAGQRFLIDAFARTARARDDMRLVLCGTGPLRGELEERARRARIGHKVTFTGLVTNDVVARYAAVADVFVLPSLLEALPTVAVEALASGTPVISADHPGGLELHEMFGDDVRLVPKGQVVPLAAAMDDAAADRRRVRLATPGLVERHFGPESVRRAYDAVYAQVLS